MVDAWMQLMGGFVVVWMAAITVAAMRFLWWVIAPLKGSDLTIEDDDASGTYQMDGVKLDGPEHAALAISLIRRKAESTPEGRELMEEFDKLYQPREVGK